jgi:hypothetical protein
VQKPPEHSTDAKALGEAAGNPREHPIGLRDHSVALALSGDFPTHAVASRIAEAARTMGYEVSRSAGGPSSRSAYVFCNWLKVRIADHPAARRERRLALDVYVGEPRRGAVSSREAIGWLRMRCARGK